MSKILKKWLLVNLLDRMMPGITLWNFAFWKLCQLYLHYSKDTPNKIGMNKRSAWLTFLAVIIGFQLLAQPKIVFDETARDFGQVMEGEKAVHTFTFTNAGDAPLVLTMVQSSCGCTTPTWTREPVKPGEKGSISAVYDSQNRPGAFNKTVTVRTNAGDAHVLTIRGSVVRPTADGLDATQKLKAERLSYALGKTEKNAWVPVEIEVETISEVGVLIKTVHSSCNCVRLDPMANPLITPGAKRGVKLQMLAQGNGAVTNEVKLIGRNDEELLILQLSAEVVEKIGQGR